MSSVESAETDRREREASSDGHLQAQHESEGDGPVQGRPHAGDVRTSPTTGDQVVDEAMVELAAAESGPLAERIDAGERAQRLLQSRLSDLGGA